MNCLWAFLGLLPGEAAGAMHRFMVLEDMMQTGIAWSLLSNCKRTFSQLLRNENILYQENIPRKFKFNFQTQPRNHPSHLPISHKPLHFPSFLSLMVQRTQMLKLFPKYSNAISWAWPNHLVCAFNCNFWQSHLVSTRPRWPTNHNLLKFRRDKPVEILSKLLIYAGLH